MEKLDSFWGNIFQKTEESKKTVIESVKEVPLFGSLSRRELQSVANITNIRRYEPGETVFYQGDPGVGMYIIEEGKISIVLNLPNGQKLNLVDLEEGAFFGELALLDESPRSADAVVKEPSILIGFYRPELFGLLERQPRLGGKIILELANIIGERLRSSNQEVQKLKEKIALSENKQSNPEKKSSN